MGIELGLLPELENIVRIRVLHHVIEKLSEGFGATSTNLKTIEKGVVEQQILKDIIFNFLDSNNKKVAEATLEIDWEKYEATIATSNGATFQARKDQSLMSQVSEVYVSLVAHVKEMRVALGVHEIVVRFRYRKEIYRDPDKLKQARLLLDTSPGEELAWQKKTKPQKEFEIEYISEKLKELKVNIRHDRP